MKMSIILVVSIFLASSCIPLRIAPTIQDYNIVRGNSFKRTLPKRTMFVFADPKEADQFYDYVNTKYQLNGKNVYDDDSFKIEDKHYFFSFYETAIQKRIA